MISSRSLSATAEVNDWRGIAVSVVATTFILAQQLNKEEFAAFSQSEGGKRLDCWILYT